jgi:hypothetical protein
MSAIEYGTTYWGVILQGLDPRAPGETVHLHADAMKIDPTGALTFTSVGRRPAGTWPAGLPAPNQDAAQKGPNQASTSHGNGDAPGQPGGQERDPAGSPASGATDAKKTQPEVAPATVYVAFAPGTWKTVYAAKLQDGAPASIEHWSSIDGKQIMPELAPLDSGASGQPEHDRN